MAPEGSYVSSHALLHGVFNSQEITAAVTWAATNESLTITASATNVSTNQLDLFNLFENHLAVQVGTIATIFCVLDKPIIKLNKPIVYEKKPPTATSGRRVEAGFWLTAVHEGSSAWISGSAGALSFASNKYDVGKSVIKGSASAVNYLAGGGPLVSVGIHVGASYINTPLSFEKGNSVGAVMPNMLFIWECCK